MVSSFFKSPEFVSNVIGVCIGTMMGAFFIFYVDLRREYALLKNIKPLKKDISQFLYLMLETIELSTPVISMEYEHFGEIVKNALNKHRFFMVQQFFLSIGLCRQRKNTDNDWSDIDIVFYTQMSKKDFRLLLKDIQNKLYDHILKDMICQRRQGSVKIL